MECVGELNSTLSADAVSSANRLDGNTSGSASVEQRFSLYNLHRKILGFSRGISELDSVCGYKSGENSWITSKKALRNANHGSRKKTLHGKQRYLSKIQNRGSPKRRFGWFKSFLILLAFHLSMPQSNHLLLGMGVGGIVLYSLLQWLRKGSFRTSTQSPRRLQDSKTNATDSKSTKSIDRLIEWNVERCSERKRRVHFAEEEPTAYDPVCLEEVFELTSRWSTRKISSRVSRMNRIPIIRWM